MCSSDLVIDLPLQGLGIPANLELNDGISLLATVIWLVGITNAINWLDGLDGLAAGVSGIAAFGLLVIHLCGLANLGLGSLAGRWGAAAMPLALSYSIALVPQLLLCCAVGLLAWLLRRLLLVTT